MHSMPRRSSADGQNPCGRTARRVGRGMALEPGRAPRAHVCVQELRGRHGFRQPGGRHRRRRGPSSGSLHRMGQVQGGDLDAQDQGIDRERLLLRCQIRSRVRVREQELTAPHAAVPCPSIDSSGAMKMMSGTRRSTGVLIVAIATVGEFAHAETTMSAYLGKSWTRSSDLTISQPATSSDATFQDVGWDSKSSSSPLYYGLRVTHFIEPYPSWGVAVDFTHYKIYARTSDAVRVHGRWNGSPVDETAPLETRVQKFNISHGVNYIGLLGLYRFRLEVTDAFPYGR